MSGRVSITVPDFDDDTDVSSDDDSRQEQQQYEDDFDDDEPTSSSESSESEELAIPQPRVQVNYESDDSASDEDSSDSDSEGGSVGLAPHLKVHNTDTPSHTWNSSNDTRSATPEDRGEQPGSSHQATDEPDRSARAEDQHAAADSRAPFGDRPDPAALGLLKVDDIESFLNDEDSTLWQPQKIGFDATPTLFLSSLPVARDTSEFPRHHGFPEAFRGSWTVQDEFVGLAVKPSLAPADDSDYSTNKATSAPFQMDAHSARACSPKQFDADCVQQLLDTDPKADFGHHQSALARLDALGSLADAADNMGESTFASSFTLLHAFLSAWNEAEEECELIQSDPATAVGCIDLSSHRLSRIEAYIRQWLRDELEHGGITVDLSADGQAGLSSIERQVLRLLVKGQWEEAQSLACTHKGAALASILASPLWSIQAGPSPDMPLVLDSKDWFARWTTGLSEDLCACASDLVEQLPNEEESPWSNKDGVAYVFYLVTGRLQELYPAMWRREGQATGARGARTGRTRSQKRLATSQTDDAVDPCPPATATVEQLIRLDWKHALAISLFYGRKDRPDLPPPPRNGASAEGQVDLFLTRIIREYTEDVVGETGRARSAPTAAFPENVREYKAAIAAARAQAQSRDGVHDNAPPKAPLAHWPVATSSISTDVSQAAAAAAFIGSRFQCREWHVLNVLRCSLELLQLQDQAVNDHAGGDGMVPEPGSSPKIARAIDETIEFMFFHAFSALALGLSAPSGERRNHQLVWFLAVVLDKTFKTVLHTLRTMEPRDVHQRSNTGHRANNEVPPTFSRLLQSWHELIVDLAATHMQERAAQQPQKTLNDTAFLRAWATARGLHS
eukprot:INCI3062.1.p1 GENE.INCI3062.1~~INCI3062.1.p1  ORF type:complete len:848 (+),score=153.03 INCI3062.1:147-2690(+)